MKMRKIALSIVVAAAASAGVVGCHDSKDRSSTVATDIEVFDGFALDCTVTANGIAAGEVGNGVYRLESSASLPVGAVVNAINCVDADTDAILAELKGVAQAGGVAVSPFTTLIVAAAVAQGGDPANLSADAITTAKNAIVEKLGLSASYDPINPATANYVKDVATNTASQNTMQAALAVSTLLKAVEKAAGSTSAETAISALAEALVASTSPVDLTSTASIQTLLTSAATIDTSVATALNAASTSAAQKVADIAGASSVGEAAAITQAIAEVLNDATKTITDVATVETDNLPPISVGTGEDGTGGLTGATGGTGAGG